jgi:hypothetical protein
MGAINYRTSDYITVGYNLNNIDYEDDFCYEWIQDDYDQVKYILDKNCSFNYFNVKLEPGYYDGFYIDIEFNYGLYLDSFRDRLEAQKEVTQIKKFLLECINDFGCCSVWPGWGMCYLDRKNTLKELNAAIKEMRSTVKNTPVWSRLPEAERC